MSNASFAGYMSQFTKEDSPRGDLARDMRDSPLKSSGYRAMLRELRYCKFACREAVETFKECHAEYRQSLDPKREKQL